MESRTLPAQQLVDGNAQRLALDVPQRHFDASERAHEHHAAAPVGVAVDPVPKFLDVVRIPADEVAFEFLDCLHNGRLSVFESRLADAGDAFVGKNLHENPVRAVCVADECFYSCDLHCVCYLELKFRKRAP